MKILVLTGSPHENGTTAALAKNFIKGCITSGHTVEEVSAAKSKVSPCISCNTCRKNGGNCIYQDDMNDIKAKILSADLIVLVSPLFYFGFTAQMKTVIDRFYAFNSELRAKNQSAILLSAGGDSNKWVMDGIKTHFDVLCKYLNWNNKGSVLAFGCSTAEEIEKTQYLKEAMELGQSL